jgi:hypothetical protein
MRIMRSRFCLSGYQLVSVYHTHIFLNRNMKSPCYLCVCVCPPNSSYEDYEITLLSVFLCLSP